MLAIAILTLRHNPLFNPLPLSIQAQAQVQDLSRQLKHAQQVNSELSSRNGELERDNQNLNNQNASLSAELAKLKALCNDLQDKVDNLSRENKQLSGRCKTRVSL